MALKIIPFNASASCFPLSNFLHIHLSLSISYTFQSYIHKMWKLAGNQFNLVIYFLSIQHFTRLLLYLLNFFINFQHFCSINPSQFDLIKYNSVCFKQSLQHQEVISCGLNLIKKLYSAQIIIKGYEGA